MKWEPAALTDVIFFGKHPQEKKQTGLSNADPSRTANKNYLCVPTCIVQYPVCTAATIAPNQASVHPTDLQMLCREEGGKTSPWCYGDGERGSLYMGEEEQKGCTSSDEDGHN